MSKHNKLLFIDTNILLDFYRCRTEAGISLLRRLEPLQQNLIMTYQIEMEFKKHRQSAILESFKQLKPPEQVLRPGLFSDAKAFRALQKNLDAVDNRVKKLRSRLKQVFLKPTTHDPVYKVLQRIFSRNDILKLTRDKNIRLHVRRLARKRFCLGYPPRKQGDTSIGDAVNWEWIIHCAQLNPADVVLVSRDSDYGVTLENESFINDWLLQEFRARVSHQKRVLLYTRLSEALKSFQIPVTKAEIEEEEKILQPTTPPEQSGTNLTATAIFGMIREALLDEGEKNKKLAQMLTTSEIKESGDATAS